MLHSRRSEESSLFMAGVWLDLCFYTYEARLLMQSRFVLQPMVEDGDGNHSLNDRYRAGDYAGIVTPLSLEGLWGAVDVKNGLFTQLRSHGLESCAEVNGLSVADATLYAARAIGGCRDGAIVGADEGVVLLRTALADTFESASVVESLAGIDAEHGITQCSMQLAEYWFAQSHGTSFDDAGNDAAYGVALTLDLQDKFLHLVSFLGVGAAHDVALGEREVVSGVVVVESYVSHL